MRISLVLMALWLACAPAAFGQRRLRVEPARPTQLPAFLGDHSHGCLKSMISGASHTVARVAPVVI